MRTSVGQYDLSNLLYEQAVQTNKIMIILRFYLELCDLCQTLHNSVAELLMRQELHMRASVNNPFPENNTRYS